VDYATLNTSVSGVMSAPDLAPADATTPGKKDPKGGNW
jgi:hypothetical protein